MRIGVFATAGYTEVGGLKPFLHRLAPPETWTWCFPPISKPGPRPGAVPTPAAFNGLTGEALVEAALERLRRYHRGALDAVLLVDDADCRFRCDDCGRPCGHERYREVECRFEDAQRSRAVEWHSRLVERVREAMAQPALPVVTLLASPEIEAWLVADWDRGFGAFLPGPWADALRHWLDTRLIGQGARGLIEGYGAGLADGSCRHKLSADLQEQLAVMACPAGAREEQRPRYSKAVDGGWMLARLDPAVVAQRCPRLAAPALRQLRALTAGQPAGPWP